MSTTWGDSTTISNLQGTQFTDSDLWVAPYLPAGDYHWRLIADPTLAAGNNVTLHKFDPAAEGFDPAKVRDNAASWYTPTGSPAMRSQIIDADDAVALDIADSGAVYDNFPWLGTSSGGTVRDVAQAFTLASAVELRKLKLYINLKNGAGASGVDIEIYSGSTYGSGAKQASRENQSITNSASWYTSSPLIAADGMAGIFLIHDAGETFLDAGANQSWDFSSFSHNTDLTATYQYASFDSDQGFGSATVAETILTGRGDWNGSWLTLAQLQAETNNNNRYFYIKGKIVYSLGLYYYYFSGDTYQVDVTPPAVPTAVKTARFESDNYALIWTEPADADYDHCELKRIIDGSTEYLNNAAGVATWQSSAGTAFEFIDGDSSAGWQQSNYTDEDVSGTAVAHYVRSVDTNGNGSAWTVFGAGSIPIPDIPTLALADNGDGSGAIATISGADTGSMNNVYLAAAGSSSWMDKGGCNGDGSIAISLAAGNYWAFCRSVAEGASSVSQPLAFAVSDPNTPGSEIRASLRALLLADTTLVNLLGAGDAVYWQSPPQAAVYPCITFFEEEEKGGRENAGYNYLYSFTCHSDSQAKIDQMVTRIKGVFNGLTFATAAWEIRKTTPLGRKVGIGSVRGGTGLPVRTATLRYRLQVFAKAVTVSFAKGAASCILPPPAPEVRKEHSLAQATGFTAGGTRVVADGGTLRRASLLNFQSLTADEFDNLAAFFSETTVGMQETFTYTDTGEVAHLVRFGGPELKFIQVAPGIYDVAVTLEEDG